MSIFTACFVYAFFEADWSSEAHGELPTENLFGDVIATELVGG